MDAWTYLLIVLFLLVSIAEVAAAAEWEIGFFRFGPTLFRRRIEHAGETAGLAHTLSEQFRSFEEAKNGDAYKPLLFKAARSGDVMFRESFGYISPGEKWYSSTMKGCIGLVEGEDAIEIRGRLYLWVPMFCAVFVLVAFDQDDIGLWAQLGWSLAPWFIVALAFFVQKKRFDLVAEFLEQQSAR